MRASKDIVTMDLCVAGTGIFYIDVAVASMVLLAWMWVWLAWALLACTWVWQANSRQPWMQDAIVPDHGGGRRK